ncbi:hypothetical protein ACIO6T_30540 [Streptomyces sp. NPDC087532]|uniref:hypothetical protein n=1 Tax=Streptomyces sp. NPDC087532 TaxID=3365795 RepID=UPI0038219BD4
MREEMDRLRKEYAEDLEGTALGTDTAPLIVAIQKAQADKEAADRRIRTPYAREFHPARRYSLNELAEASGCTISGVRTTYGDPEVTLVQSQIGRAPRRAAEEQESQ